MRAPAAVVLLGLLLAGCGSPSAEPGEGGMAPGDGVRVEGLVVTAAITPLEGATVALAPTGRTALSGADGRFHFDGVPDGEYLAAATRPGYIGAHAAVVVEGGRPPPLVQMVLDADRQVSPYLEGYSYQGYLDFSFTLGPLSGSGGGIFGEASLGTSYALASRLPDWVQAEMAWSPTGALSERMMVSVSPQNGSLQTISQGAEGPSPLAVGFGRAVLEEWEVGGGDPLAVIAFVGNHMPEPAPAAGLALAQPFELFTHLFYGHLPPDGWRFSADGNPPPPP